LVPLMHHME